MEKQKPMMPEDWTEEQLEFIKSLSTSYSQKEQYEAFQAKFNLPNISKNSFRKKAWKLGVKSRYEFGGKGRSPWNKNTHYHSGSLPPVHKAAQFSISIRDGIEYIKIGDTWMRRSAYEYEKYYGVKVDNKRTSIIHLDRDVHNFAKENLVMMTRGELCIFNRYHKWSNDPKENLVKICIVKNTCAIAKLKRKHGMFPYNQPSACKSVEFDNPVILEKVDDCSNE